MRSLPSHQQRKVAKRAKFLDKIRVASLSATKRSPSAKKRKSAKGLSASSLDFAALSATLGEAGVDTAGLARGGKSRMNAPGTLKRQQRLVASESDRLRAVLARPAFRADPAAAVTNHVVAALEARAAAKQASVSRHGSDPKAERGKHKGERAASKGGVSAGAGRAAREASDAVAAAAARRSAAASARGITHRGGDDRRGPKDQLGVVHHASRAKKGAGGKKGSKRSKKRARETW